MRIPVLPHQRKLIQLDSLVRALVGGFGCGKTYILAAEAITFALRYGLPGAIVSPSLPMAKRSVIPLLSDMLEKYGIWHRWNNTEHCVDIAAGRMWILSGHDPETLKGSNLGWVGIDEPFLQDKRVYLYMMSRLRIKNPRLSMMLTGTPEQLNWGYELLVKKPQPFCKYVTATSYDNPTQSRDVLDAMERTYSPEMKRAFMLGEFVQINSRAAYYSFSALDGGNVRSLTYNPNLPLVLTCDFNRSPMCWNVLQEPRNDKGESLTYVLDEIHVESTNTYQCVDEFIRRWHPVHKGKLIIGGDYSGASLQGTTCTVTNFQVLLERCQDVWGHSNVSLELTPNPPHIARLNLINAELCNSRGQRRLFFDRRCEFTIDDYMQARIQEGTQNLDKAARDPHHADAVDYRVYCRLAHERMYTTRTRRT